MSSSSGRREVTYCAECRGVATQLIEKIIGAGDFGVTVRYGLCDTHCAELVRTADGRYAITPLPRGKRARRPQGEQQQWDMPGQSTNQKTSPK